MVTAFQRRVYDATRKIPRGRVVTYGELALRIGCGSPRAVGQALRVNPFSPEVPCHRVVAADGSLTGFGGKHDAAALARKRRLLEAEGVIFDKQGRVVCAVCQDRLCEDGFCRPARRDGRSWKCAFMKPARSGATCVSAEDPMMTED